MLSSNRLGAETSDLIHIWAEAHMLKECLYEAWECMEFFSHFARGIQTFIRVVLPIHHTFQ